MRRVIAILLVLFVMAGMFPVRAFATESPLETTAAVAADSTDDTGLTEPIPDAPEFDPGITVYVTVSDRGELAAAYQQVAVPDFNQNGSVSVEEALQAIHTVFGKGDTSVQDTGTELWGMDAANVTLFRNHTAITADMDTVYDSDYLVLSVNRDPINGYDRYSRFDAEEKTVQAGSYFTLTLTDDYGTALAGMELGLADGNGNTILLGLCTDENGQVTLALEQEGFYCLTAKGTVIEQSYHLETGEFTAIETPIIAPVCIVEVIGNLEDTSVAAEAVEPDLEDAEPSAPEEENCDSIDVTEENDIPAPTEEDSAADIPEETIAEVSETVEALTDAEGAADTAYETLPEEETVPEETPQMLSAEETDQQAADYVAELIGAIGEVTQEKESAVEAAREAYAALSDAQKALVTNYATLVAAEETLSLLHRSDPEIYNIYQTTAQYLCSLDAPVVGSTNGEWRVIGLVRGGFPGPDTYYETVVRYVTEYIDSNNRLHRNKSTENARVILALTAMGKDVTDVAGKNLISGLNDMTYIGKQGINGTIWALIAFDSHDYEIPAGDVTRERLVQVILDGQLSDGGWALAGTASDPDMTGMALTALAPYCNTNASVQTAVDKALSWLSGAQRADGTFGGSEGITCESLAQVITALTTLGIDPENDSRFVKNSVSALDALASFYVEGGGFRHGTTGERNMMATEQAFYGLVSYYRFLQNQKTLYDMSDVILETDVLNREAADAVIAMIQAIGQVDLTKEEIIQAARAAYDALSEPQKQLVTNYETLTDAETALAQLKQNASDVWAAETVKALIDAIGTVTLDKHAEITAARAAYNALTQLQKDLVGAAYLRKLTDAESALAALEKAEEDRTAAQRVITLISNIGTSITLGSESKIQTARNAYNALTADQKNLVTNYQTLVRAEAALNQLKSTVTVTFSLLGCYEHGAAETSVHTLAGGNLHTWIAAKTYRVQPGSTVKDLFEQALTAAGISWKNPTGNYVEAIRYNGAWIGEFTNGQNSGWMYTLNGKHPNLGVAQQTLVNKDVVVFHYTDDFTREEGGTGSNSVGTVTGPVYNTNTGVVSDGAAAEAVERMIEDIGEVTLESETAILAARAAYDKLSESQKKLVKKYDDLVAAEAKLAELKGTSGEDIYTVTGDYLQSLGTPGVGAVGGEWLVIGLARSGRSVSAGYYDHVCSYVLENIDGEERLHRAKSSDNSRLILALTAIGRDVTNVAGHNLLKGLEDMDYIRKQGINGPIWALLAFDSGNYPTPAADVSRESLLDVILGAQLSDGGWALSGDTSDPDMTGMALQALAPYTDSRRDVQKAVEEAIWCLSKMQNDNGSFSGIDGPSSESIAQVMVALAALGIDADTDARFVKNGISALDALMTYYISGGGFRHVLDGNLDGMATEQAYYAMVAYDRMQKNQNFLYDMTDVVDAGGDVILESEMEPTELSAASDGETETKNKDNTAVIWISVMSVCAAAIALLLLIRKKIFGKRL